jgi:hypothetical protein
MNFTSLTNLTKDQRQYLVLGGVVAIILIVLIVFGVKVSLSSIGEAKLETSDLTSKIEGAERLLDKRDSTKKEFAETSDELRKYLKNIPPERNYYSWATEIIYATARLAELEIDAIDEQTGVSMDDTKGKDGNEIKLEAYSLRITAHGGFNHFKNFLERIEEDQPLVRVTGIDISTGAKFDVHDVQLFIQWPFNLGYITDTWGDIASKQEFLGARKSLKTKRFSSNLQTESDASAEETPLPTPEPERSKGVNL